MSRREELKKQLKDRDAWNIHFYDENGDWTWEDDKICGEADPDHAWIYREYKIEMNKVSKLMFIRNIKHKIPNQGELFITFRKDYGLLEFLLDTNLKIMIHFYISYT